MNLLKKISLALLTVAVVVPTIDLAEAQRRDNWDAPGRHGDRYGRALTLDLNDGIWGPRNPIVYLKQELKAKYPRIQLDKLDLLEVEVWGASFARRAAVSHIDLVVSGRVQDSAILGQEFHGRYDHVVLANRTRRDDGVWQLHVNNRTRLSRIIVHVSRERGRVNPDPRPRPGRLQSMGIQTVEKFIYDNNTFWINGQMTSRLQLRAGKAPIDVQQVTVTFSNGAQRNIPELTGRIWDGADRTAVLRNIRNVEKVEVIATSINAFGSRGTVELLVGR